jgi:hypothetical protein
MENLKNIEGDESRVFVFGETDGSVMFSGILSPDETGEANATKVVEFFQAWLRNRDK